MFGRSSGLTLHCRFSFSRRKHAGSGDGRGGVSGVASLRQAARRGMGRAGGGQFHYRRQGQPEPPGEEQEVQVSEGGREQAAEGGGKSGLRAALRFAGEPARLFEASHRDDDGGLGGHAERNGTGAKEERQVFSSFHERMLRRSRSFSATRRILGTRESHRAARRLRRSEAFFGSDDHGVSPLSQGGHAYRANLQYLWAADAVE